MPDSHRTAQADAHDPTAPPGLPRRGFVMTGLMAGFTPAIARAQANPPIHTDAAGLVASEIRIPTADGMLPGYLARPQGDGPFPRILVIEEIFGVHEFIKDVCRRLAHRGYLAIAPELYARIADLSQMTDPQRIVHDVIDRAPDATMLSDLDAAAAASLGDRGDPARLGVIGFCRGGRDTWLYAEHNPALRAAVAFYGPVASRDTPIQPRNPLELAASLKCPLLGLYGERDDSIALSDVRAAQARARDAGHICEIETFAEAGHGFFADYRPSYHEASARRAWELAMAWFARHGL